MVDPEQHLPKFSLSLGDNTVTFTISDPVTNPDICGNYQYCHGCCDWDITGLTPHWSSTHSHILASEFDEDGRSYINNDSVVSDLVDALMAAGYQLVEDADLSSLFEDDTDPDI